MAFIVALISAGSEHSLTAAESRTAGGTSASQESGIHDRTSAAHPCEGRRHASIYQPRMRSFALIVLACALVRSAHAQIPFDTSRNQGVGATVGLASGTGISYQEILPSALGYRAVVLAWKKGDGSFVDVGISGLRVLSDDGRRRVYLLGSIGWWRRSEEETELEFDEDGNLISERVFDDIDDSGALGLGAGVELPLGTSASASLEGVFTYWTDSGDLIPAPQVSIHWLF